MASESTSPPAPWRVWAPRIAKVALVAVAFWVVSTKVSWDDAIERTDGSILVGRFVEGAGPNPERIVIRTNAVADSVALSPGDWKPESKRVGLRTAFSLISPLWYAGAMLLLLVMYTCGINRWRRLLIAQGLPVSFTRAFRLTFIGFFSNNFVPGLTGGDLVKAIFIARESPGRRSEAVSTVIADRVIGLVVLAGLSAVAILFNFQRFERQSYVIFGVLAVCAVAFVCFFSRRVRRLIRLDKILRALPGREILMKLDQAFLAYRSHPRTVAAAVLLSGAAHFCTIAFFWVVGRDLEIPAGWLAYFAAIPVILIAASVPLFPGGWGVREVVSLQVFVAVGVGAAYSSQIVLLAVIHGFSMAAWSLLGGLFLLSERRGDTIEAAVPAEPSGSASGTH